MEKEEREHPLNESDFLSALLAGDTEDDNFDAWYNVTGKKKRMRENKPRKAKKGFAFKHRTTLKNK